MATDETENGTDVPKACTKPSPPTPCPASSPIVTSPTEAEQTGTEKITASPPSFPTLSSPAQPPPAKPSHIGPTVSVPTQPTEPMIILPEAFSPVTAPFQSHFATPIVETQSPTDHTLPSTPLPSITVQPTNGNVMVSRCTGPVVDFSIESGLAATRAGSVASMLPTFDSTWAGLPSTETCSDRALCTNVRDGPEPMHLDLSRMSGLHNWKSVPVNDMSFRRFVLQEVGQKVDMLRFRQLSLQDNASAMESWSQFGASFNWWEIPSTLKCSRTFARDVWDCYYLDKMHVVLDSKETLAPHKFPLFADELMGRWWNAFRHRPNFMYERYCHNRYGLLINYDSYETMYYTDVDYEAVFPKAPEWQRAMDLPPGVPLPIPPVLYYYHHEMVVTDGKSISERCRRLWQIYRMELCTMFCAFWFNEAVKGGRLFNIKRDTVAVLRNVCKDVKWVDGTKNIFSLMETVLNLPPQSECFMVSNNLHLSSCVYFHSYHGTGQVNTMMKPGLVSYLPINSRRIKLGVRQQRRMEERRSSPMSLTLHPQDLMVVEGLPLFINAKRWDLNGHLTVRGLLSLLYDTASRTTRTVDQLTQEMRRLREENDSFRYFINGAATGMTAVQPRPTPPPRNPRETQTFRDREGRWRKYYWAEGRWHECEDRDPYERIDCSGGRHSYGAPNTSNVRPRDWPDAEADSPRYLGFRRSTSNNDY